MTKAVIYRNNSAYEQFLAPALIDLEGFEIQVFPQGTSETEITAWIAEHADWIRSMEKAYMDRTCYEAGKSLPSAKAPTNSSWDIWKDVSTNYGGFDQVFQEAARSVMTKATVEETIAEVVRHMLVKEVPDQVFVVQGNMGDHDLFGSQSTHSDRERAAQEDAEKLRSCLETVIGKPVTVIEKTLVRPNPFSRVKWTPLGERAESDTTWVFHDRHNRITGYVKSSKELSGVQWFRVPIENLVEDVIAFGIQFDVEAYSRAIRDKVATW